jgi:hypothetical protein
MDLLLDWILKNLLYHKLQTKTTEYSSELVVKKSPFLDRLFKPSVNLNSKIPSVLSGLQVRCAMTAPRLRDHLPLEKEFLPKECLKQLHFPKNNYLLLQW